MNSTSNRAVKPEQDDSFSAVYEAVLRARGDKPEIVFAIAKLAFAVREAKEWARKLEQATPDHGPVLPSHGADSLLGEEFVSELIGWQWALDQMLVTLDSHLVEEEGEEEEDESSEEPADAPHVAELPSLRGRPYWQAREEGRS